MFIPVILCVRLAILGLALWGVRSRDPRFHAPAILALLAEFASLVLAHLIVWDPRAYAAGDPGLRIWFTFGPALPGSILIDAMTVAPIIVLVASASGAASGFLIWRWLWRRHKRRVWTVVAALGAIPVALLALEIGVEATMRLDAMRIPHAGGFERTSALEMALTGASELAARHHASLGSDIADYTWSFRKGGWVRSPPCKQDDAVGCYAQDWR